MKGARKSQTRPWLYADLHETSSLDEATKLVFALKGDLPSVPEGTSRNLIADSANELFGFLFVQVHQGQLVLNEHKDRSLDVELAAWDLSEEGNHELLVGYLLARIGAIPQSIVHVRRSMELALAAAFLSTTALAGEDGLEHPLVEVYLSNLWQYYATKGRVLSARDVIMALKSRRMDVTSAFQSFTYVYIESFASQYCPIHFADIAESHQKKGLPPPVFFEVGKVQRECSFKGCGIPGEFVVADLVPTVNLLREVVRAVLRDKGYTNRLDSSFRELYDRTSGFVHVTREAHRHGPSFEEGELKAWGDIVSEVLSWMSQFFTILWTHHGIIEPKLLERLEQIGHDFSRENWGLPASKNLVCSSMPWYGTSEIDD